MEPRVQDHLCLKDATKFANPVLESLKPMARGIVGVLFFGILGSGSTLLTRIARAVWPEKPIRTAINLLSRYLVNSRVPMEKIRQVHLEQQARKVSEEAWVYIDPSDAAKPYARILEYLAWVRDASLDRIVKGYWTLHAVAVNGPGEVVGLVTEIFSVEHSDSPSFPGFVWKWAKALHEALEKKGIFVMDQGLSSNETIEDFTRWGRRFVMRIVEARRVFDENGLDWGILADIGGSVPYDFRMWTLSSDEKKKRGWDLFWRPVRLAELEEYLFTLVCVRWLHRGELKYFFLLTNLPIRANWQAERVLRGYLGRQVVEDYIRFVKQEVQMEKFLVQDYRRIQRVVWVAGWVANFLVEQNGMGVRRKQYFIRELNSLVKEWKELWTLAAWGFQRGLKRIFQTRSLRGALEGLSSP